MSYISIHNEQNAFYHPSQKAFCSSPLQYCIKKHRETAI